MNLTRKLLKALGIENEATADSIIEAHTSVTKALTEERDRYKAEAEKVPGLTAELETARKAGKTEDGKDYKQLYDDLVKHNDAVKSHAAKEAIFRKMAEDAGVAKKFINTVVKASAATIDGLELDGETVKDAEAVAKSIKTDWADFIPARQNNNHEPGKPPANGGSGMTRDEIMAIKDDGERQQAIADNMDLFS